MFSPKLLYQLRYDRHWPTRVAFLDSPRQLAAANQLGDILVWNLPENPPPLSEADKKGKGGPKLEAPDVPPAFSLIGHTNEIVGLNYEPIKKRLYSASWDRTIKIWSLEGKPTGMAEVVLDLGVREDKVLRSKTDRNADIPLDNGTPVGIYQPLASLEGHEGRIRSMALSHDGNLLATGDTHCETILWDLTKNAIVTRWKGFDWNQIISLEFAPDNKSLLVFEYNHKRDSFDIPAPAFRQWNLDGTLKLDLLKTLVPKYDPKKTTYGAAQSWKKVIKQGLVSLDFSPDGKYLAAAQGGESGGCKAMLLNPASGKLIKEISGHENGVQDVLFTPDGKHLITAGRDTIVRIVQVPDGKEVAALGKSRGGQFKDWTHGLSLSADGKFLACADISGIVPVWQLNS